MAGHLVVGGAEVRVTGSRAVLGPVDELPRMLDAGADREGLLHHLDALVIEHGHGVPGGVAEGQDHAVGLEVDGGAGLFPVRDAVDILVRDDEVRQGTAEPYIAAETDDLFSDVLDHFDEVVRADVGVVRVEDGLRRAEADEVRHDLVLTGVLDAGGQLAVGERAGAAFAELDVRGSVEAAVLPEVLHVLRAGVGVVAALEDDGLQACFREGQGAEHAGGAEAHDDRPEVGMPFVLDGDVVVEDRRLDLLLVRPFDDLLLIRVDLHVDREDEVDVLFFAGVHGPAEHLERGDVRRLHFHELRRF